MLDAARDATTVGGVETVVAVGARLAAGDAAVGAELAPVGDGGEDDDCISSSRPANASSSSNEADGGGGGAAAGVTATTRAGTGDSSATADACAGASPCDEFACSSPEVDENSANGSSDGAGGLSAISVGIGPAVAGLFAETVDASACVANGSGADAAGASDGGANDGANAGKPADGADAAINCSVGGLRCVEAAGQASVGGIAPGACVDVLAAYAGLVGRASHDAVCVDAGDTGDTGDTDGAANNSVWGPPRCACCGLSAADVRAGNGDGALGAPRSANGSRMVALGALATGAVAVDRNSAFLCGAAGA